MNPVTKRLVTFFGVLGGLGGLCMALFISESMLLREQDLQRGRDRAAAWSSHLAAQQARERLFGRFLGEFDFWSKEPPVWTEHPLPKRYIDNKDLDPD
jgi:hypothetical protein